MTRDNAIGDTLILAEKYNALLEASHSIFPKIDLRLLELKLENNKKTEILHKNQEMLSKYNQLKNQVSC